MIRVLVAGVFLVLIQGCSVFSQPKAKPVIEERVTDWGIKKVGVLATTPERRVVLVKMPGGQFCAEPSADAADNVSAALSAIAEASAKGTVSDVQLGFAQSLATTVKQLFVRSQGIQLYRDGSFVLCNAYLNQAISEDDFLKRHIELLRTVAPLIEHEIPHMHKIRPDGIVLPVLPVVELKLSTKPAAGKPEEAGKNDKTPAKNEPKE